VNANFFTLHDSNNYAYGISYAANDKSIAGFPHNVMTQRIRVTLVLAASKFYHTHGKNVSKGYERQAGSNIVYG
jgi:hypothetical protein